MAALALLTGATLGAGALLLRAFGVLADMVPRERLPMAFVLGFGVVGWLMFLPAVAQILSPAVIAAILVLCLPGLWLLRGSVGRGEAVGRVGWLVIAGMVAVAGLDLAEALAPPADADSLAYHFELPRRFIAAGGLEFEPLAVDRAVPLLTQMTYTAALALGGERAMTLWTMLSGWAAAALVWAVCRRHLSPAWSLAAALAWQTIPTVSYAAGTGQIEVRTAMFALAAALGVAESLVGGRARPAALGGAAAGFFAASKYPGLFFLAGAGLVMLAGRRPRAILAFSITALLAGCQWYLWNAVNTGDPVFPSLYGLLPYKPEAFWSAQAATTLKQVFTQAEIAIPRRPDWLIWYPFAATLFPDPVFEAGRVGLGPLPLLLSPFAVAAAWQQRARLKRHRLGVLAAIALLVYALWFMAGPSQRVRHLLPLMPLVVVVVVVAAARLRAAPGVRRAVSAAMAIALLLQLAGAAVVGLKNVRRLVTEGDRASFLASQVGGYMAARWLNANLGPADRVLVGERQILYLLDVPYVYGHWFYTGRLSLSEGKDDPARFWAELRALGITHVLSAVAASTGLPQPPRALTDNRAWLSFRLVENGCAVEVGRPVSTVHASRTLPGGPTVEVAYPIMRLTPASCRFEDRR